MARFALLLLVLVPVSAGAQQADSSRTLLQTRGAFWALSVPDVAASTRWYEEKLGLSIIMQIPKQNKHAVAVLKGGGLTVELIQNDDAIPVERPAGRGVYPFHGIVKVGLVTDDFELTLQRVRSRGIEIALGPWAKSADQPAQVIIKDNAGNLIQLFGP